MLRSLVIGAMTSALLTATAWAQAQFGTAAEAKAMLEKAVSAVKADKAKALDQMQKGEGGFKDRDSICSAPTSVMASSQPTPH